MGLLQRMLRQTAVYWPRLGEDDYGQPVYDAPVEIKVRWEDVNEQFLDQQGATEISRAKIYVDRDLNVGDAIRLGALSTMDYPQDPCENTGVHEIRSFQKTPDIRAKNFLRVVMV